MSSQTTIDIPQGASRAQIAKILNEQGYHHQHGHHLTFSEGPYRDTIDAMYVRNPSLRNGRLEFATMPDHYGKFAVLTLERSTSSTPQAKRLDIESSVELDNYLSMPRQPASRRIFIVEGVARDLVHVLGTYFNMDPASSQRKRDKVHGHFHMSRELQSSLPRTIQQDIS